VSIDKSVTPTRICQHVIVMGVAGSGKSSVASALGEALGHEVIEGDAYHPQSNIEKMAAGIPLTDEDRRPWLETLAGLVGARHAAGVGTVLACSALRRSYRDILRSTVPADESFVIQLDAEAETLRARMAERMGHFMPVSMLESQLATLEPLELDERGIVIDVTAPLEVVIGKALSASRSAVGWT
jgi:gluconokinase